MEDCDNLTKAGTTLTSMIGRTTRRARRATATRPGDGAEHVRRSLQTVGTAEVRRADIVAEEAVTQR